jgi:CO dehydrogenase maturation factor
VVILDMEAGIEHLGRATAGAVDKLIVVVEPGRRSLETAATIRKLARDINLINIAAVGNKIRGKKDMDFLTGMLADFEFLGFIPYDPAIVEADVAGLSVLNASQQVKDEVKKIYQALGAKRAVAKQISRPL